MSCKQSKMDSHCVNLSALTTNIFEGLEKVLDKRLNVKLE